MQKVDWVKCPFGVFELRWRRKSILHDEHGQSSKHDYLTDEVRGYARWPEDGWRVVTEAEAREAIGAMRGD